MAKREKKKRTGHDMTMLYMLVNKPGTGSSEVMDLEGETGG